MCQQEFIQRLPSLVSSGAGLHQGEVAAMKVDAKDAKRKQLQEWQKGQRGGLESRTSELELWGFFYCVLPPRPFQLNCQKILFQEGKTCRNGRKGKGGESRTSEFLPHCKHV